MVEPGSYRLRTSEVDPSRVLEYIKISVATTQGSRTDEAIDERDLLHIITR